MPDCKLPPRSLLAGLDTRDTGRAAGQWPLEEVIWRPVVVLCRGGICSKEWEGP